MIEYKRTRKPNVGDLVRWGTWSDVGLVVDTRGIDVKIEWLTPIPHGRLDGVSLLCDHSWIRRNGLTIISGI
jgi:hypothetical protein